MEEVPNDTFSVKKDTTVADIHVDETKIIPSDIPDHNRLSLINLEPPSQGSFGFDSEGLSANDDSGVSSNELDEVFSNGDEGQDTEDAVHKPYQGNRRKKVRTRSQWLKDGRPQWCQRSSEERREEHNKAPAKIPLSRKPAVQLSPHVARFLNMSENLNLLYLLFV